MLTIITAPYQDLTSSINKRFYRHHQAERNLISYGRLCILNIIVFCNAGSDISYQWNINLLFSAWCNCFVSFCFQQTIKSTQSARQGVEVLLVFSTSSFPLSRECFYCIIMPSTNCYEREERYCVYLPAVRL